MNKLLLISIILLLVGIICFLIVGYVYYTLHNYYEVFVYYGLEKEYYTNAEVIKTALQLKYGIAKFTAGGIIAWIASLILFLKGKRNLSK